MLNGILIDGCDSCRIGRFPDGIASTNVITGTQNNITIQGGNSQKNIIDGNFIGLFSDGVSHSSQFSGVVGVLITQGAHDNFVGLDADDGSGLNLSREMP